MYVHKEFKLEINLKRTRNFNTIIWRLSYTFLNNPRIQGRNLRKIRNYLELYNNEHIHIKFCEIN